MEEKKVKVYGYQTIVLLPESLEEAITRCGGKNAFFAWVRHTWEKEAKRTESIRVTVGKKDGNKPYAVPSRISYTPGVRVKSRATIKVLNDLLSRKLISDQQHRDALIQLNEN